MKAFVFDLDGTLLNRSKRIGSDTHSELMKRVQCGDKLILATSRPIRAVRRFVPTDFIRHTDTISLNGAIHHTADGTVTQHSFLRERAQTLITYESLQNQVHIYVEIHGECFATNAVYTDQELYTVHSATQDMVIPLDALDYYKVSKIALNGRGMNIEAYSDHIHALGLKSIPCLDGTFLNIVDPETDKSTTLRKVLEGTGINMEDVYVFGDDIPDIEMMKMGGISIAVSNAKDAVKEVADYIIGDCDDDGIGHFIRRQVK